MTKLKPAKTKSFYSFIDMSNEVNKELGFDQRDCGKFFHPETGEFSDWHKMKNLPKIDPEGKHVGSSNIWYAQYMKEVESGKWKDTPYLDFWHWQLDKFMPPTVRNGTYSCVYVGMDKYMMEDAPDWVIYIQKSWNKLYKDIADDHGYVDVWISW